jgi:hypothetical protein
LYNGLLPFGLKKNSQGIPVPDPETYPGLLLAFRLAAEGRSDREVAEALNAAGYRSTGNRGHNPFTRDSVCILLQNRFYLGELPAGRGGWTGGAHEAVLDDALFEAVRRAREANRTSPAVRVRWAATVSSLSGLAGCGRCGGRLHFYTDKRGRGRVFCYQRQQTARCAFRPSFLAGLEEQLVASLATFHLPDEAVAQLVALDAGARAGRDGDERRRAEIAGRLARIKELYGWGDLNREAYQAERERLQAELAALRRSADQAAAIAGLAAYLRDLPAAWRAADGAERNRIARLVF